MQFDENINDKRDSGIELRMPVSKQNIKTKNIGWTRAPQDFFSYFDKHFIWYYDVN